MRELLTRARAYEESENVGRNPTDNPTIGDVIAARLGRRDILKGALGVAAIAATVSPLALAAASRAKRRYASRFRFDEIEAGIDKNHHVAAGYDADVLIRWGDPVVRGRAGVRSDASRPPPRSVSSSATTATSSATSRCRARPIPSQHGLLAVNLEYTNEELMFPGLAGRTSRA